MDIGLISILSGIISLLSGGILSNSFIRDFIFKIFRTEKIQKTYTQRITELTESLKKASNEVDSVILELTQVAREREDYLFRLETDLTSLQAKEKKLKDNIETLQNIPIPVADHFSEIIGNREKRNAWRDYILFGAGVILTTLVAIILQIISRP